MPNPDIKDSLALSEEAAIVPIEAWLALKELQDAGDEALEARIDAIRKNLERAEVKES